MDYFNAIGEVGAVTAQNRQLPSPELLGVLCAREARKRRPKTHSDALRVIAETLHRIFPSRVHLTRDMFTVH
ncbi:hypothetical protein J2W35_004942 [Variovorax boronicumulans]|uniref:hypothetical protein n=1 Tax=Variovorax boronicumulans TaxID=436515 RepID=UPI002783423E|nr:hypothetical protein [Variovorax boronicumulans]MDQ0084573.1 hypothetical protein [Variovorax boronicumulans]